MMYLKYNNLTDLDYSISYDSEKYEVFRIWMDNLSIHIYIDEFSIRYDPDIKNSKIIIIQANLQLSHFVDYESSIPLIFGLNKTHLLFALNNQEIKFLSSKKDILNKVERIRNMNAFL